MMKNQQFAAQISVKIHETNAFVRIVRRHKTRGNTDAVNYARLNWKAIMQFEARKVTFSM